VIVWLIRISAENSFHQSGHLKNWGLTLCGVASLYKEWNLQEKENGRKMVNFSNVWNLQRTENARKDEVESARKGNCKEQKLQGIEIARN